MKKLIIKLKKIISQFDIFSPQLPIEGSLYIHNKKGSEYNGMTGIVKHHNDKKAFMINCETNCLCNIKPLSKWKQLLISNI